MDEEVKNALRIAGKYDTGSKQDEPVMRSYEPSWSEKFQQFLMGTDYGKPSPERRRFSEGLTDVLSSAPGISNVLSGERLAKAMEEDDLAGAGAAALGMIPGASGYASRRLLSNPAVQNAFKITRAEGGRVAMADGGSPSITAGQFLDPSGNYVRSLFKTLLNREPDASGLNYWKSQIDSGNINQTGLIQALANSGEFKSQFQLDPQKAADALAFATIGRKPTDSESASIIKNSADPGAVAQSLFSSKEGQQAQNINYLTMNAFGLPANVDQMKVMQNYLNSGKTINDAAQEIYKSPIAQFGSNVNTIRSAYRNYLGREPTTKELDDNALAFYNKQSNADQLVGQLRTNPDAQKYAQSQLTNLYAQNLGRAPDQGGLNYWSNQLLSGQTPYADIAKTLQGSQEAKDYTKNVLNAFAQNYLGRDLDQSGLDFWSQQAAKGVSLGDIQNQFANSAEARQYGAEAFPGIFDLSDANLAYYDQNPEQAVNDFYKSALGQAPDKDTQANLVNQLRGGKLTTEGLLDNVIGQMTSDQKLKAQVSSELRDYLGESPGAQDLADAFNMVKQGQDLSTIGATMEARNRSRNTATDASGVTAAPSGEAGGILSFGKAVARGIEDYASRMGKFNPISSAIKTINWDNAKILRDGLEKIGMPLHGILGAIGNFNVESIGIDPRRVEGVGKRDKNRALRLEMSKAVQSDDWQNVDLNKLAKARLGIGVGQWTGDRAVDLIKAAKEKGVDWRDMNFQTQFLADELQTKYPQVIEYYKNNPPDPVRDVSVWERAWENPNHAAGRRSAGERFSSAVAASQFFGDQPEAWGKFSVSPLVVAAKAGPQLATPKGVPQTDAFAKPSPTQYNTIDPMFAPYLPQEIRDQMKKNLQQSGIAVTPSGNIPPTPPSPSSDQILKDYRAAVDKYNSDYANWKRAADLDIAIKMSQGDRNPQLSWALQVSKPQPPAQPQLPNTQPQTQINVGEQLAAQGAGGPNGVQGNTGIVTPGGQGQGVGTVTGQNTFGYPTWTPPGSDTQALLDKTQKDMLASGNTAMRFDPWTGQTTSMSWDPMTGTGIYSPAYLGPGKYDYGLLPQNNQPSPWGVTTLGAARGGVIRAAGGAVKPDDEDVENALRIANAKKLDVGSYQRQAGKGDPEDMLSRSYKESEAQIPSDFDFTPTERRNIKQGLGEVSPTDVVGKIPSKGRSRVIDPEGREGSPLFVAGTTPEGKNVALNKPQSVDLARRLAHVYSYDDEDLGGVTTGDPSFQRKLPFGLSGSSIGLNKRAEKDYEHENLAHETGHAIHNYLQRFDEPFKGAPKEVLEEINDRGLERWEKDLGKDPKRKMYALDPKEQFAESVRSYMMNPAGFKARNPATAKYLRSVINTDPRMNKLLFLARKDDGIQAASSGGAIADALRLAKRKGGRINTKIDKDPDFDMSMRLARGGKSKRKTRR